MKTEWIFDKLPARDKDVLIVLDDDTILMGQWKNDKITRGHHWEAYFQEGFGSVGKSMRHVKGWMPLPEPPTK